MGNMSDINVTDGKCLAATAVNVFTAAAAKEKEWVQRIINNNSHVAHKSLSNRSIKITRFCILSSEVLHRPCPFCARPNQM